MFGHYAPNVISFLFGGLLTFGVLNMYFFSPADAHSNEAVSFFVDRGANLKTVAKKLETQGLVNNWASVYYTYQFQRTKGDGGDNLVIFPGEYILSRNLNPRQILQAFIDKKVNYRVVTIPEGSNLTQVADLLSGTQLTTKEQVLAALGSRALLMQLQIPESFEGYLFPNTYQFTYPESAEEMVQRMVKEGQMAINPDWYERATELTFSFHQIITLASIIEKETGDPSERALISAVFHNRLRIGMPLQSDPTVIYGIPNFDGNLTKDHLKTDSPYNTYMRNGLPPTPICNPGLASIEAALYPADSDFLYFVSRNDGTHAFAPNYKEHQKNVQQYQKKQSS